MAFTLPELTYGLDALEPHIDAKTMEIHHGKHHGGYVTKLNGALEGQADLAGKSLEDLISSIQSLPAAIQGAAAGAVLHLGRCLDRFRPDCRASGAGDDPDGAPDRGQADHPADSRSGVQSQPGPESAVLVFAGAGR